MSLNYLCLNYFRNHTKREVQCASRKFIILSGDNGVGKTNVLEAISFFSPGKGFRSVKSEEILSSGSSINQWGANIKLEKDDQECDLSTGAVINNGKAGTRVINIDSENIKKKDVILNLMRVLWLTPQMDGIFLDSSTNKRKFFDRIVYNFFPSHAVNINKYNYYLRSRNKLLVENYNDNSLYNSIEKKLAELYVLIANDRVKAIQLLQESIESHDSKFLRPIIKISGLIESDSDKADINALLKLFQEKRVDDKRSGKTNLGAHKTEFNLYHRVKKVDAKICSTGEQKAMLIALTLAQARAIYKLYKIRPIILFDEVFAHLDISKTKEFVEELNNIEGQFWITTTDTLLYKHFNENHTLHIKI